MTIGTGDKIPSVTINVMTADGPGAVVTDDFFKGRKVALFGVPGAFTRTCSAKHLPGFVNNADALKQKGIDEVACISVNDAFVMDVWGKGQNAGGKVTMLADGSANFAKACGLDVDMGEKGYGLRCRRFSMIIDDGVIKVMHIDAPGTFETTAAEVLLDEA